MSQDIPIVLVYSKSLHVSSTDIISRILKNKNSDLSSHQTSGTERIYIHEFQTKYFTTSIGLYPLSENNLESLSSKIKEKVEGFLIYFDSSDKTFSHELPAFVGFIKERQLEFCIVLCDKLSEEFDGSGGISYTAVKNCCDLLDVIELDQTTATAAGDEDSYSNKTGFDELIQALESFIWSNINVNSVSGPLKLENNPRSSTSSDEIDVESELENFENLLNTVSQFRPRTSDMSREDRFNQAEAVAQMFEKLLYQDDDSIDLND